MPRNVDTNTLLGEVRKLVRAWEAAKPGSRAEYEAAEAATRVMAELDVALCEGAHPPVPWQRAQYPEQISGELTESGDEDPDPGQWEEMMADAENAEENRVSLRQRIRAALDATVPAPEMFREEQVDAVMEAIRNPQTGGNSR